MITKFLINTYILSWRNSNEENKIFAVLTTSALLLAACSNGDNASDSGQKDGNQKMSNLVIKVVIVKVMH